MEQIQGVNLLPKAEARNIRKETYLDAGFIGGDLTFAIFIAIIGDFERVSVTDQVVLILLITIFALALRTYINSRSSEFINIEWTRQFAYDRLKKIQENAKKSLQIVNANRAYDIKTKTLFSEVLIKTNVPVKRVFNPDCFELKDIIDHIRLSWGYLHESIGSDSKYRILFSREIAHIGLTIIDDKDAVLTIFDTGGAECLFMQCDEIEEFKQVAQRIYKSVTEGDACLRFPAERFSGEFNANAVLEWLTNNTNKLQSKLLYNPSQTEKDMILNAYPENKA